MKIGKYNEEEFEREAILFYKPFLQRKLSKGDFVSYVLRTFTLADFLIPIALLAAAAAVGVIIPKINHFMFSEVVQDGNNSLLISTAVFMLCLAVSKLLLKTVHSVASSRVDVKMSFSVQSAMMMRMLSLPSGFSENTRPASCTTELRIWEIRAARCLKVLYRLSLRLCFRLYI